VEADERRIVARLAELASSRGVEVRLAYDGMEMNLEQLASVSDGPQAEADAAHRAIVRRARTIS